MRRKQRTLYSLSSKFTVVELSKVITNGGADNVSGLCYISQVEFLTWYQHKYQVEDSAGHNSWVSYTGWTFLLPPRNTRTTA